MTHKKHAVIIGANSYIARNMLFEIQERYPDWDIKTYDRADVQSDGFEPYASIDVTSAASMESMNLDCDYIFMFVGKTGTSAGFDDFTTFIDVNEKALLYLLNEYRRQESTAKIIFPSTRLVYKGSDTALSEDAPKEFKTVYAMNKYSCEQYLHQYHQLFGVNYCVLRICVPYGSILPSADSTFGTAGFMLKQASEKKDITLYGGGTVRRTLTHMADLTRILCEVAADDKCTNDVYNIGGEDYSLNDMANLIASKYGTRVQSVEWPEKALLIESGSTVFNDDKLQKLGHSPAHSFGAWINAQEV